MSLSTSNADPILKQLYRDENLEDLTNNKNPFLMSVDRFEKFNGRNMPILPLYGNPQTVSADFATAQSAAAGESSKWGQFLITGSTKYSVVTVTGDIISQTRDDMGSFVRAVKNETDRGLIQLANSRAGELFRSGWGDIGVIGTVPGSASTITLATASDGVAFEKGQKHVFAATQSTSVLRSASTLTVVSVARSKTTTTVVYSGTLASVSAVAGDSIFNAGDRQNSATPARLVVAGVEAWCPVTAPTAGDSFFGQDRSVDSRLYGISQDSSGQSLEEAFLDADASVGLEGGQLDKIFVNPRTYAEAVKSLGSRVRYQDFTKGKVGFSSLMVAGQSGDIAIIADRSVPANRMYGLESDSWLLVSDKKFVRINDDDGLIVLRQASGDGVEVRLKSAIGQLTCKAPNHNINIQI